MRLGGRLSAAIDILTDFETRRVPLKTAIADWSRGNRYAGAKDRAFISGLCLDALRRRASLASMMADETPRAAVIGAMRAMWSVSVDDIAAAAGDEHGPGALTPAERDRLADPQENDAADYPQWLAPHIARVFGDRAATVMRGFCERADIDLRLNTIKAAPDKALAALKTIRGEAVPFLATAARIAAPEPSEKAPGVTIIPAYNKGWVEVQDLGSQIAATAAGAIKGAQVLDYCAGGGGKTLALAAMMENTGQLYAYDRDARRLAPLFDRAKRAGVRNVQVRSPAGGEGLDDLAAKMDVVFVDAPCTGAGTWRRHPDTKWRLTEAQLQRRLEEQDEVLREAARFVKPGGRMVWVTCSFLMEENEDRLTAFLATHRDFSFTPALAAMKASGLLTAEGEAALSACVTPDGAIRMTPDRLRADGFFVAALARA